MVDFYAEAAKKRVETDRKKKEIARLKRIVVGCQRKLGAITDQSYTPLSANGYQILVAEIRKCEDRIKSLSEGM